MMDGRALRRMILPLFLEQLLVALVGLADVFVVGFVGEAAVSGVSLVNSFNTRSSAAGRGASAAGGRSPGTATAGAGGRPAAPSTRSAACPVSTRA